MKHKYLYILSVLSLLLGFTACSSEDITDGGQHTEVTGDDVIVKASIGANSVFTRSNPIGNAEEQGKFNHGDIIFISDGNQRAMYKLADDGQTWNFFKPADYDYLEQLKWDTNEKTFYAHYPVYYWDTSGQGIRENFNRLAYEWTIPSDQSIYNFSNGFSGLALSDVMTAKVDETKKSDHTLNLTFERQTARIILKFSFGSNQFRDLNASIASVTVMGTRSLNTNTNQQGDITEIIPYKANDNEFVALSFPQPKDDSKPFLKVTVQHAKDAYGSESEVLTLTGIPALDKGMSYTFNVLVGKEKVSIGNVSVNDWGDGGTLGTGEASETYK